MEPEDFSFDLAVPLADLDEDPQRFLELVKLRTQAAPAQGRDYFAIKLTLPPEDSPSL